MAQRAGLRVEVGDHRARVTLDRPEVRNALSGAAWAELADTVRLLDRDPAVSVIVLTGADPAFCAGFDLRALSSEERSGQRDRMAGPPAFLGMLPPHEVPVIGAVNGPAVTGGLELALACDFLIASDRARFADTHARVGVMPGAGLTILLPRAVGQSRARQMSLTGDFVDATTALAWGLVNEVVPHDQLLDRADTLAGAVASIPTAPIGEIRRMYDTMAGLPGEVGWRRENDWSRSWMADRFDQARLAGERSSIIERGRSQQ